MISIDYTLIIVILNFVLLLIILNKILYKPIVKFLTERQKKVSQDIDNARISKEEATLLVEKRKKELKESAQEVRKINSLARKEASKQADQIIKEAYERDKKMLTDNEEQLENEKEKVMEEIQSEIAQMVSALSEKVLLEKLSDNADKQLIEKIISESTKK